MLKNPSSYDQILVVQDDKSEKLKDIEQPVQSLLLPGQSDWSFHGITDRVFQFKENLVNKVDVEYLENNSSLDSISASIHENDEYSGAYQDVFLSPQEIYKRCIETWESMKQFLFWANWKETER